jgi:hypothetical protein
LRRELPFPVFGLQLLLAFIIAQRRQFNFRLPGIGAVDGLAVVAQGLLREPFWIASGLGALPR